MDMQIPIEKILERYQNENAQLTRRAIIAETSVEVLQARITELEENHD